MSEIKIIINGKECVGKKGQTILEIAGANGIFIPTLCHLAKVKNYGACGVCVVEGEYLAKFIEERPFMWATHVWNMFDFAADARNQGGEPGMNHKGLVTFDRKIKKDSFYLYKAYWSKEPFVHVCGSRYVDRAEATTKVKVYSNQPQVTLLANGKEVATKQGERVFTFDVPLQGEVHLEAVAGDCTDTAMIRRVDKPNPAYKLRKGDGNGGNWV